MGLSVYINNKTLKSNFSEVLAKYDTDNNGFTKQEFSVALKGITSIFARQIIKLSGYDKKLFNQINIDNNDIISYEELGVYFKEHYNLDLYKMNNMTFKEICEEIDNYKKE